MQEQVDLSIYDNSWYKPGKSTLMLVLWYAVNAVVFKSYFFPFFKLKVFLLRMFGAEIGEGVLIKPNVNIKYPWRLKIGDHSWIGEEVWIDNLAEVSIGRNCCLSQGCFLLCGNHDYKKTTFDLIIKPIVLEEGSWVGAKTTIAPGAHLKSHAIVSAGSFFSGVAEEYTIYAGNPAKEVRKRVVSV